MSLELFDEDIRKVHFQQHHHNPPVPLRHNQEYSTSPHGVASSTKSCSRRIMLFGLAFIIASFVLLSPSFALYSPWEQSDRKDNKPPKQHLTTITTSEVAEGIGHAGKNELLPLTTSTRPHSIQQFYSAAIRSCSDRRNLQWMNSKTSMTAVLQRYLNNLLLNRDLLLTSPKFHQWKAHPFPILQNTNITKLSLKNRQKQGENKEEEDVLVAPEYYAPFIRWNRGGSPLHFRIGDIHHTLNWNDDEGAGHNNPLINKIDDEEFRQFFTQTKPSSTSTYKNMKTNNDDPDLASFMLSRLLSPHLSSPHRNTNANAAVDDTANTQNTKSHPIKVASVCDDALRNLEDALIHEAIEKLLDRFEQMTSSRRRLVAKNAGDAIDANVLVHKRNEVESPPTTTFYYDGAMAAEGEKILLEEQAQQLKRQEQQQEGDVPLPPHVHVVNPSDERKLSADMKEKVWKCFSSSSSAATSTSSSFRILFIGTSNTRTLMTNIQARLEGTRQMSRVSAKQMCDNSVTNHSCFVHVVRHFNNNNYNKSKENDVISRTSEVFLDYYGYKEDLFHPSLKSKIDKMYVPRFRYDKNNKKNQNNKIPVDLVIMSTGINTIQTDASWNAHPAARTQKLQQLQDWIYTQWLLEDDDDDFVHEEVKEATRRDAKNNATVKSINHNAPRSFHFIWHAVTPLCPNMPHFRRYRYRKSKWSGQPVEAASEAARAMNDQVRAGVFAKEFPSVATNLQHNRRYRRSSLRFLDSSDSSAGLLGRLMKNQRDTVIASKDGGGTYAEVYDDDTTVVSHNNKKLPKRSDDKNDIAMITYPKSMFGKSLPEKPNNGGQDFPRYCFYYEDPLHHRFLDRAIADVIMNMIC